MLRCLLHWRPARAPGILLEGLGELSFPQTRPFSTRRLRVVCVEKELICVCVEHETASSEMFFFFPILNCDQKTLFTMQPMQNAMNIFDTGGDAWP